MVKPGRAYWKGHLRLSLVSIPVEIFNAVETADSISFNQIHKPTGKRVKYTKTVPGVGEVRNEDIVKGYQIERDSYVLLEPHEIDAIRLESKSTIDLSCFVAIADVDPRHFERPYYLLPSDDNAAEGYLVIREALAQAGKAGIGQVVIGGREHLVAVAPLGKGLVLEIIRYGSELKPAEKFFGEIPDLAIEPELVEIAGQIIERKSASFEAVRFHDRYATALKELVAEKAKGATISAAPEARESAQVVDLMAALKRSLEKTPGKAEAKRGKSTGGSKRKAG
jgi:DNA end-binding protein Ku